jgi:DNA-binding NtrC family response regulator
MSANPVAVLSSDSRARICLVENDEIMGESLCDRFRLEGFEIDWKRTAAQGEEAILKGSYAAIISDVRLPDRSGELLFGRLRERMPAMPPFIFITGYASIDRAVALLKDGAADYVSKPFELDELVAKVRALSVTLCIARSAAAEEHELGISSAMRGVARMIPRIAMHAPAVLITGESGVGKERVAELIHRHSAPAGAPFVAVNCGAFAESLLEAELFGYERGAFTGAVRSKRGMFELAHGGTLFLDEVGDMPLAMQVKVLRAIQDQRVVRVGEETAIPVRFKLICATNRDLRRMVETGHFREDLYFRVNVIHLRIVPLRERREDILWFARRFLMECAEKSTRCRASACRRRRRPPCSNTAGLAICASCGMRWRGRASLARRRSSIRLCSSRTDGGRRRSRRFARRSPAIWPTASDATSRMRCLTAAIRSAEQPCVFASAARTCGRR